MSEAPLDIDAEQVAGYLEQHPDFFVSHRSLLAGLRLPHDSGKSISLVERQVDILRERTVDARRRMNELLETARVNDALFAKTRSLTLAMLDCQTLQELNEVLATHFLVDFDADFVCCHVRGAPRPDGGALDHFAWHTGELPFAHLLSLQPATCTPFRDSELTLLFPMSRDSAPGSAVLLPMPDPGDESVLAIGSRDAQHFSNDMDTLFVRYIADVLTRIAARVLGGDAAPPPAL